MLKQIKKTNTKIKKDHSNAMSDVLGSVQVYIFRKLSNLNKYIDGKTTNFHNNLY